jgi:type IV pilus assembly protein PilM
MFKKQIFGLDISDHSIEALILEKPFFGVPKVVAYARMLLRGEVVKNGVIKKPEKLAENIIKLLESAKPKPIRTPYCILSLPESQIFTAVFKLPAGLKYKEIKNTIPYKAEEVIPFKSSEIYFDFKPITQQGDTQEVFYVAAPSKVVDSYVQVLTSVGLKPIAFDLESISSARALTETLNKSGNAKILLDIGARTTNLNIFDRNGIRQSLTIKIAGDRFTKVVATKLKIAEKQAEELKVKNGFDPKLEKGRVALILQSEFKRIVAEAKKVVEYYQAQTQRKIDQVILLGGSALLPSVDQYLADNLLIEAVVGNPLAKITDPKELAKFKNKSVLFTNVVGLALRGVGKGPETSDINLLPLRPKRFSFVPDRGDKRGWKLVYVRLAVLLVFTVILAGLFVWRQQGNDLYQKFFPIPKYDSQLDSGVDPAVLEELRQYMLTPTTTAAAQPEVKIKIKPTTLGFLNFREGPGESYKKTGQVNSGNEYKLISEQDGWYQIQVDEKITGWVASDFAEKIQQP